MAWTSEQLLAITERGKNIIVSAGAGSGKTAVLSERILDYCLKGNDIRNVLVLTFTSAAAQEMKERIRFKLLENGLFQQADYIDAAYITTFDAYSLALVKKYYYKLGLSKKLSIMDQALIKVKRREIISGLFTELYENEDQRFFNYLKKYSKQDDKEVFEVVEKLCDKFELIINYEEFKKNYEDIYYNEKKLDSFVIEYEKLAINKVNYFISLLDELLNVCQYDLTSVKLYDSILEFKNNLLSCNVYEDYYRYISGYSMPRVSAKADIRVKELKEICSLELSELKAKIFNKYIFKADMLEELKSIKNDILFLLDICDEVRNRLLDYKKSVMLFDYTDIAKFAIKLVTEDAEINKELKYYYKEILVDEYQDTSDIQEAFLNAIENNNMYMVGDIKQSIYRFRNANPYIFKNKYDSYSLNNGGIKIDLSYNFRSRLEVLNNINLLFSKLMTNDCGDANYILEHQMKYGQKNYENIVQDYDFNLDILRYDYEQLEDFTKEEKEAFICAKYIKDIYLNKNKVLKKDSFEEVKYSDFAILIDKAKSFVIFKQIFEYLNIPLSIEADLDLKDSILPKLYSNILLLISKERNKEYDKPYTHALVSLARSFIYEYSDNDIYELVLNNKHFDILDDIKMLAELKEISYSNLFYKIAFKLDIYDKLALIGDVDNSVVVLEYIHNMFKMFESTSMTISEASNYLISVFESDIKLSYKMASFSKDSVRIMTIHKSKGLEFAYCLFPLLGSSFNKEDVKATIGFDSRYGIYIPFAEEGKSNTIVKTLISESITKADVSERVRLLYVALTRAREKMVLVMDNKEENINPLGFKSFKQMINYFDVFNGYIKDIDLNDYSISKDYKLNKSIDFDKKDEILDYTRLSFNIDNNKVIDYDIDSILNDIELSLEEVKSYRASKVLKKLPSESERKNIKMGLEYHAILEAIDLANPDLDSLGIDDSMKNIISNVLDNQIFKNIRNGICYKEHEFYLEFDDESYHGIIDLFVVYDDYIDLIDYKLSNVDDSEYVKQLSIYEKYISSRWNKKINVYLLSILKNEIQKIIL